MQTKKVCSFLLPVIILASFFIVQNANCDVFYTDELWWWISGGLDEVKTGEIFTIGFQFTPDETIEVDFIRMEIWGNIGSNGEVDNWEKIWDDRTLFKDQTYTEEKSFLVSSLPSDTGGKSDILGMVTGAYYFNGERRTFHSNVNVITLSSEDPELFENLFYVLLIVVSILSLILINLWNKQKKQPSKGQFE